MKQKTITTSTVTILVVELPEGAINAYAYTSHSDGFYVEYTTQGAITHRVYTRMHGNWQLIARLPELTEKQAKQLVKYIDGCGYINHRLRTQIIEGLVNTALEYNGIIFENPYPKVDWNDPIIMECDYEFVCRVDERHKKAQSKVWDRNRTYIFKQLK